MACIFCDIIAGRSARTLVYEDRETIVINDIHPQAATHLLVIPKKHVSDLLGLTESETAALTGVVRKIIRDKKIIRYRIVHNGGGAQLIDHVHVHVMGAVDPHRDL